MALQETSFERRKRRTRFNIKQCAKGRIRLSVARSNKQIYAQLIDDEKGITLVSASSLDKDISQTLKTGGNVDAARAVGELIALRAKKQKIDAVVFDRGGYIYHGRVKALADAARKAGLSF